MKKDTYYFSHDYNANSDEKLLYLRSKFGMEGYGLYWYIIEKMHESKDSKLTCSLIEGMAFNICYDADKFKNFYNECLILELFITDGVKYWSDRVNKNKEQFEEKRKNKSIAGKKGMEKRWPKEDVITENSSVITEHNKVKESKVNESKLKEIIIKGKKFLNNEFNELPDMKINSAIELLNITKKTKVSKEQIDGLWEVFKVQNLTGENYYPSEEKVYSHFINWVKTQNFKDADNKKPLNEQRFDAYVEYANRHS